LTSEVNSHRSVLLTEVVELLRPKPGDTLVDTTLGAGGHAEALLERLGEDGRLIGIDRDRSALSIARDRLRRFGSRFVPVHGTHENIIQLLQDQGASAVDGIFADLGVSSMQLDSAERGFSFRFDGPLDMRMDQTRGITAAELLETISLDDLTRILRVYGEERLARRIARAIVEQRERRPIRTTLELAALVKEVAGPRARRYRIHPATRTFQALRIRVNEEIEGIERFITDAVSMLGKGGRIAVISFHSLEDRAVKLAMRSLANRCTCPPDLPICGCNRENFLKVITGRVRTPLAEEIETNPRARSAKLRVGERIG
jgi:16S rRNA (cytosine1402-N4)-methyltransferase